MSTITYPKLYQKDQTGKVRYWYMQRYENQYRSISGIQGRDHGFPVECKGWCFAKPNKRKRWNYQPATKCLLFSKRERTGLIIEGQGLPTEEQLETIRNFIEEKLG